MATMTTHFTEETRKGLKKGLEENLQNFFNGKESLLNRSIDGFAELIGASNIVEICSPFVSVDFQCYEGCIVPEISINPPREKISSKDIALYVKILERIHFANNEFVKSFDGTF